MTRLRKSYAEVVREALALMNSARPEALLSAVEGPVEGRAPNALPSAGSPERCRRVEGQREFGINDDYAWELFRPPPSMLPASPRCWTPKVERDEG
jgi:hypothetical protein